MNLSFVSRHKESSARDLSQSGNQQMLTCTYPQLTPQAPKASAAANPLPLPIPPEARYGTFKALAAKARRINPPTSSSPGCPAHSNPITRHHKYSQQKNKRRRSSPSTESMSTPNLTADWACLIVVHLWIT